MKQCKQCGFQNLPQALFCGSCGNKLLVQQIPIQKDEFPKFQAAKPKAQSSLVLVVAILNIIAVVFIAFLFGAYLLGSNNKISGTSDQSKNSSSIDTDNSSNSDQTDKKGSLANNNSESQNVEKSSNASSLQYESYENNDYNFKIDYPVRWAVNTQHYAEDEDRYRVTFKDPDSATEFLVDAMPLSNSDWQNGSDPVQDWYDLESKISGKKYSDYSRDHISATTFNGHSAAEWVFYCTPKDMDCYQKRYDLGFQDGSMGYAILFSSSPETYDQKWPVFQKALDSFQSISDLE